ncbi:hypothetical protein Unana1_08899 [Umbelopsis nana]
MSTVTGKAKGKDIVSRVIQDHEQVKTLWSQFQAEKDRQEQEKIANQIIYEVAVHSHAEELILYPSYSKSLASKGKEIADHSRLEHDEIKKNLYKVDRLSSGDENLEPELKKVMKELEQHMHEEEHEFLPEFEKATDVETLESLGKQFEAIKMAVPTRPHPSAPDKPLMETLISAVATPVDKLRDLARSAGTGFKG